jgi:hypothetical protein
MHNATAHQSTRLLADAAEPTNTELRAALLALPLIAETLGHIADALVQIATSAEH